MKTMIAAIALSIALPAIAHAETTPPAPAETPKMKCCCKDKDKLMDCCEEQGRGKAGEAEHSGHDMDEHRR